jgi:hypothetical protein
MQDLVFTLFFRRSGRDSHSDPAIAAIEASAVFGQEYFNHGLHGLHGWEDANCVNYREFNWRESA